MKVCVIGGAGYIGSHAVYELIRDGQDVVVIDNLSTGDKNFVHPKAKFYNADITKKEDLINIFKVEHAKKSFDVVMHFAAKLVVSDSVKNPLEYYYNNVEGVRIMLEVMSEFNIKNVVFSSTAAVYGNPATGICHEDDYLLPINPYGESKLASERMIQWISKAHGMNYAIFRYFNVAGADESLEIGDAKVNQTHLVPIIVETALGIRDKMYIYGDDYETPDGTCIRDYVHVSDIATAHVMGAKYLIENNKSLILNLGSNNGYSVREVINEVAKLRPVNYEVTQRRSGDPDKLIASNNRVKKILGWEPKYDLSDIIESDMNYRIRQIMRYKG